MEHDFHLEPARARHAYELAPTMREADAAEVYASSLASPLDALQNSIAHSTLAFAARFDGELGALFGVRECPGTTLGGATTGIAWLLTGTTVDRHRKVFLRESRAILSMLLSYYPVLFNYVDSRYAAALRWARRLGFDVLPPQRFGALGLPFFPIIARASCVT